MKPTKCISALLLVTLALSGMAAAAPTVGILSFEEKNAPGVAQRVRDSLTATFKAGGFEVIDAATLDRAVQPLNVSERIDSGVAAKIGKATGCDWIVTGRVFGTAGTTFIVAKMMSTTSDNVTGEAQQVEAAEALDGKLNDLGARLVELLKAQ